MGQSSKNAWEEEGRYCPAGDGLSSRPSPARTSRTAPTGGVDQRVIDS